MKHLLLPLALTGLVFAQDAPDHRLEVPEDSLLAKAIARTLKEAELPEGSSVLIEIGPAKQTPTPTTPRLDQDPDS